MPGWTTKGIDIQNVISGAGYTLIRAIDDPALGMEALEAVNTWMSDHLADAGNRLIAAANLRYRGSRLGNRRADPHARSGATARSCCRPSRPATPRRTTRIMTVCGRRWSTSG